MYGNCHKTGALRVGCGGGWGGGLDLQYEMPRCMRWKFENRPILKDVLVLKYIHIEGIVCTCHTHIVVISFDYECHS